MGAGKALTKKGREAYEKKEYVRYGDGTDAGA